MEILGLFSESEVHSSFFMEVGFEIILALLIPALKITDSELKTI